MVYEQGTIKVVWIDGDGEQIYSKMFTSIKSALEFAKGKDDYLVFRLVEERKMEDFVWELLPYGRADMYRQLMKRRKSIKKLLSKLKS